MKTMKMIALFVCLLMFAGIFTACDDGGGGTGTTPTSESAVRVDEKIEGIDFSNDNINFLSMYYKPADSSPDAMLELVDFRGGKAAKITPAAGSTPYVVIDAASLLGSRLSDVKTVEVGIAAENSDGTFYAVSGEIIVFRDWKQQEKSGAWSVYLDNRNPNIATMTLDESFSAGEGNFFVINRRIDNAVVAEKTPSNLYITKIGFLDAGGAYLPVNADAVFDVPEGFNDVGEEIIIQLGEMNVINSPTQQGWLTNGTDGKESHLLGEEVSKAVTLVLEFDSPPEGEMQVIWLGDGNGWDWNQVAVIPEGGMDDTRIEVNLTTTFDDYEKFKQSDQMKIFIGYYTDKIEDLGITNAYLIAYED
ncbi:MAG: hypothetical protein FWG70_04880 [Oscillospiraceae bacterium]|nr:hypothetical protein [Oscillospiraceae bacterium]